MAKSSVEEKLEVAVHLNGKERSRTAAEDSMIEHGRPDRKWLLFLIEQLPSFKDKKPM